MRIDFMYLLIQVLFCNNLILFKTLLSFFLDFFHFVFVKVFYVLSGIYKAPRTEDLV